MVILLFGAVIGVAGIEAFWRCAEMRSQSDQSAPRSGAIPAVTLIEGFSRSCL
jgi:hypothetical protein